MRKATDFFRPHCIYHGQILPWLYKFCKHLSHTFLIWTSLILIRIPEPLPLLLRKWVSKFSAVRQQWRVDDTTYQTRKQRFCIVATVQRLNCATFLVVTEHPETPWFCIFQNFKLFSFKQKVRLQHQNCLKYTFLCTFC